VQVNVGIEIHEEAAILQKSVALTLHRCDKADVVGFVFRIPDRGAPLRDVGSLVQSQLLARGGSK